MSKRRSWAALSAVALMSVSLLAAGCAATSSAGAGSAGAGPAGASAPGGGSAGGAQGSPTAVPTTIASTPAPVGGIAACTKWPAGVPTGPLPASFTPVEVLRCVTTTKVIPGKGLSLVATMEKSTSGITKLVAALRHPVARVPAGTACPMIAMLPPQVVLVAGDGSLFKPAFPLSACGLIDSPVLAALNAMPWQPLSVTLYPLSVPAPGTSGTVPAGTIGNSSGTSSGGNTSPGQQPVDLVPGVMKGTPQVNGHS